MRGGAGIIAGCNNWILLSFLRQNNFFMKNVYLFIFVLCVNALHAQIKVGDNPTVINQASILELESNSKGFLPTRMTSAERDAINQPPTGLILFNTTLNCLQLNFGSPVLPDWACISSAANTNLSTNGSSVVANFGNATCDNPSEGTINGVLTEGVVVSEVTMTLYANVTALGFYSLSATENGVTFSGAGIFTTLGCQPITLIASGTPTTAGPFTWCSNTTPHGCSSATVGVPSTNGTAVVSNYGDATCSNPSQGIINGAMTEGVAVSGVTMTLYANVTALGTYNLSATENGVTFTGSGSFTTLGCQPITLTASGTPTAAGPFTWCTNSTAQGCGSAVVATAFNPAGISLGTGTLSGNTCFDIALSNDNANSCGSLSSRTANQSDFSNPAIQTQTYTFTPSGTVSNVRFYYVNEIGNAVIAISGGNPGDNINSAVTASVNYNTGNNSLALGLNNSNGLTTKIYVVYNRLPVNNNNPLDDRILSLTANVKDCNCCIAKINATDYKEFLCHNLGADISLDPFVGNVGINGAYIQWGKRGPVHATGDSRFDWQIAGNEPTLGFAAAPVQGIPNSADIVGWSEIQAGEFSWRSASGVKGFNDPCPTGYRVPTLAEWTGVSSNNTVSRTGTWTNNVTNYGAMAYFGPDASTRFLPLPAAGARDDDGGNLVNRGTWAAYWSSDHTASTNAFRIHVTNIAVTPNLPYSRLDASTVRCIKD
jgi:uncharacterized protein (TIGR02145 family)